MCLEPMELSNTNFRMCKKSGKGGRVERWKGGRRKEGRMRLGGRGNFRQFETLRDSIYERISQQFGLLMLIVGKERENERVSERAREKER